MIGKTVDRNSILKAYVSGALKKVVVFFALSMLVAGDVSQEKILRGLLFLFSMAFFFEYFFFVRPNVRYHKILLRRLGEKYERTLNDQLVRSNLETMFRTHWFVKEYKKIWAI